MKQQVLVSILGILAVPALAGAAPCVNMATLDTYIALGARGCSVDNVQFANFSYRYTIPGIPPNRVTVQVFTGATAGGWSTLKFLGMWRAVAGQRVEAIVGYDVALPTTGFSNVGKIALHLGPSQVLSPTGSIRVDEKTEVGTLSVWDIPAIPQRFKRDDQKQFTPVTALKSAESRIVVIGGTAGATATYFSTSFTAQTINPW